jgi:hypothetical protein
LKTLPPDARIELDGATIDNPFEADLPHSADAHKLTVSAKGHRTERVTIAFDHPAKLTIALPLGAGTHESQSSAHARHLVPPGPTTPPEHVEAPPHEKPLHKGEHGPDKPKDDRPIYRGTHGKLIDQFPDQ